MLKPIEEAAEIYNSRTQDFGLLAKSFLYAASTDEILEYLVSLKTVDKFSYLLRNHLTDKFKSGTFPKIKDSTSKKPILRSSDESSVLRGYFSKFLIDIFPTLKLNYQIPLFRAWVLSERPIERIRGYNSFVWVKSVRNTEALIYNSHLTYGDRRAFIQIMLNGSPSLLDRRFPIKAIWNLDKYVISWRVKKAYFDRLISEKPIALEKMKSVSYLTFLVGCGRIGKTPNKAGVLTWLKKIKDRKELRITVVSIGKTGDVGLLKLITKRYSDLFQSLPEKYMDPEKAKWFNSIVNKNNVSPTENGSIMAISEIEENAQK